MSKVVIRGAKGKEFKKYENRVQRFIARLERTTSSLHKEGHLDDYSFEKIKKVIENF